MKIDENNTLYEFKVSNQDNIFFSWNFINFRIQINICNEKKENNFVSVIST